MINQSEWVWYGQAGHFCCADECRYHLHTHVGHYCVSTVGEHITKWYRNGKLMKPFDIDGKCFYETMVFDFDEADRKTGSDVETKHTINREEAQKAHMELCYKYASL